MNKIGKSKLSLVFDISGIALMIIAIFIVKFSTSPLVEILAGVLATIGFGLTVSLLIAEKNRVFIYFLLALLTVIIFYFVTI